ncbi:MAG: CFI-box-CTERM domain-containing protein [Methyloligella sp. ZOD6]
MLLTTRRRMLGLAAVMLGARLLPPLPAAAQDDPESDPAPDQDIDAPSAESSGDETPQCFVTKEFGPWTGKASNIQAGAGISEVEMTTPCDFFWTSIDVSENYEAKISIVGGDPGATPLDKDFLLRDDNRLVARDAKGKVLRDVKLCGVCTDLQGDEASIVLPLDFAPYLREAETIEFGLRMGEKQDCRFTLQLDPMRQALAWATQQRDKLQAELEEGKCQEPQGCFLTTACCDALGLPDNCFELATLRRYRDRILAATPEGREAIADYYRLAPPLLSALQGPERSSRLLGLYWRYILPSAITAKLHLNGLTFRIYSSMISKLQRELI